VEAAACTLRQSWTGGGGVGVLVGVGVGFGVVGVGFGVVGVGAGVVGGGVTGLVAELVGAGVVGVAELIGPPGLLGGAVGLMAGVDGLMTRRTDAESSCSRACRTVAIPGLITAASGCCPHMFVAAAVWAYCVPCAPARNALISPEEISDTPANMLSVDDPTRRALIMAPSSWSSRLGSRVHDAYRNVETSIPVQNVPYHSIPTTPVRYLHLWRLGLGVRERDGTRAGKYQSGCHGPD
jgi:hypothetical protein